MLDVSRNNEWILRVEDDYGIDPYQITINDIMWTRISLMSAGNITDNGKFIPYECISIVWQQHRLDDVYINEDKKQLSLREILIANDML